MNGSIMGFPVLNIFAFFDRSQLVKGILKGINSRSSRARVKKEVSEASETACRTALQAFLKCPRSVREVSVLKRENGLNCIVMRNLFFLEVSEKCPILITV